VLMFFACSAVCSLHFAWHPRSGRKCLLLIDYLIAGQARSPQIACTGIFPPLLSATPHSSLTRIQSHSWPVKLLLANHCVYPSIPTSTVVSSTC